MHAPAPPPPPAHARPRRPPPPGRPAPRGPRAGRRAADAELGQQPERPGRGADRGRDRREGALHAAQRDPVLATALALAHVPARLAAGAPALVVGAQELALDLDALGVARLGRL